MTSTHITPRDSFWNHGNQLWIRMQFMKESPFCTFTLHYIEFKNFEDTQNNYRATLKQHEISFNVTVSVFLFLFFLLCFLFLRPNTCDNFYRNPLLYPFLLIWIDIWYFIHWGLRCLAITLPFRMCLHFAAILACACPSSTFPAFGYKTWLFSKCVQWPHVVYMGLSFLEFVKIQKTTVNVIFSTHLVGPMKIKDGRSFSDHSMNFKQIVSLLANQHMLPRRHDSLGNGQCENCWTRYWTIDRIAKVPNLMSTSPLFLLLI